MELLQQILHYIVISVASSAITLALWKGRTDEKISQMEKKLEEHKADHNNALKDMNYLFQKTLDQFSKLTENLARVEGKIEVLFNKK